MTTATTTITITAAVEFLSIFVELCREWVGDVWLLSDREEIDENLVRWCAWLEYIVKRRSVVTAALQRYAMAVLTAGCSIALQPASTVSVLPCRRDACLDVTARDHDGIDSLSAASNRLLSGSHAGGGSCCCCCCFAGALIEVVKVSTRHDSQPQL